MKVLVLSNSRNDVKIFATSVNRQRLFLSSGSNVDRCVVVKPMRLHELCLELKDNIN